MDYVLYGLAGFGVLMAIALIYTYNVPVKDDNLKALNKERLMWNINYHNDKMSEYKEELKLRQTTDTNDED